MSRNHWKVCPKASEAGGSSGLHPLIIQLLYNRGITEPSRFEAFLKADASLVGDPFLLPDMPAAVSRVYRALLSGEKIAVYGDFDADGVTATAVLVQGLSVLGGDVIPYIPHRFKEGYGIKLPALQRLKQQGVSLVITVDCGVSAVKEAREARQLGLEMIITDHHRITTALPEAAAVVEPRREDSVYPFPDLAGVGVAYKLLEALLRGSGKEAILLDLVELVALGTVADMVPLIGENRYLVKSGLQVLNKTRRPGLVEMINISGLKPGNVSSENISWSLAPRLNATGRVGHAITSYQLLLTEDPGEARNLAIELENKNAQRQKIAGDALKEAREKLMVSGTEAPVLFSKGKNYPSGVIGIVAGRLAEEFYRPVFLIRLEDGVCRGSSRSIPEFDVVAALKKCNDLLLDFGGHATAAGFAINSQNIGDFETRLLELAQRELSGLDLRPHLLIDAEVPLSVLNEDIFKAIQELAPFGSGNPVPAFLSRSVKVAESRKMGGQSEHLQLKLQFDNAVWQAVGFRLGDTAPATGQLIDIVYKLEKNHWNEEETLRLNLLDLAPSV